MQQSNGQNLMRVDRAAYVAAGAALLAWAARRPSIASGTGAAAGAMLLYQAYTGRNPMFGPLGIRVNPHPSEPDVRETIVIDEMVAVTAPPQRVYEFWRELRNLQRIAPRLREVEVRDEQRSRWRVATPAGIVEWDAEITRDIPGREIAWRTTRRRSVTNFGTIEFTEAPGGRGTIVRVHLEYVPPAGSFGTAVARLVRESPQQIVNETLRRLRQVIETGEVATTDGQPAGSRNRLGWRNPLTRSGRDRTPGVDESMVRIAVGDERNGRVGQASSMLSRGLGWFSVGLGAAQIAAPRMLARSLGVQPHPALLPALGLREIVSGAGILARRRRGWLWSRVAGDAMDLALLGLALRGGRRNRVATALAAVAGVTMLDVFAGRQAGRTRRRGRSAMSL